ncbi:hypothetical protein V5799_009916 [Amblyomma americanum]|uniref:Uncharacterized protein n=1 Tax=Amblyomma americanum TaxID=6943 RepID=A0AAQ4F9K6_AMBAM
MIEPSVWCVFRLRHACRVEVTRKPQWCRNNSQRTDGATEGTLKEGEDSAGSDLALIEESLPRRPSHHEAPFAAKRKELCRRQLPLIYLSFAC